MLLNWPRCSFIHWLSFGLGLGLIPVAPGTWGSVLGLGLAWCVSYSWGVLSLITGLCIMISFWVIPYTTEALKQHDHAAIVIDEVAGQMLTCACVWPLLHGEYSIYYWISSFFLFRVFDIFKFGWVRYFDQKPHNSGVTLDDLVAGIYAAVIIWLIHGIQGF